VVGIVIAELSDGAETIPETLFPTVQNDHEFRMITAGSTKERSDFERPWDGSQSKNAGFYWSMQLLATIAQVRARTEARFVTQGLGGLPTRLSAAKNLRRFASIGAWS
jgi:hypothetical protein